jgi:hypothetical protein
VSIIGAIKRFHSEEGDKDHVIVLPVFCVCAEFSVIVDLVAAAEDNM